MAYVQTNEVSTLAQFGAWLENFGANLKLRAERNARFRTTYNELNQLSDRDLSDLGMSRSMIRSIAWESAVSGQ